MTEETTATDPLKSYLPGEEGSKFKTLEDLAKAKYESDQFIDRIKEENANIRKELAEREAALQKARGIDEVLNALKSMKSSDSGQSYEEPGNTRSEGFADRNQSPAATDEDHVRKLIESTLSELNTRNAGEKNWRSVEEAFLSKHNNDSEEALVAMKYAAKELDMTMDEFREFARMKPQAALRATGIATPGSNRESALRFAGKGGSEGSSTNQGSSTTDGPRPKSYYDNLKKSLPSARYWSPEIQNRLHKDASAMGDEWFKN